MSWGIGLRMIKLQMMMKSNSVCLIELDIAVKERTNADSCIMKKSVSVIYKMDIAIM